MAAQRPFDVQADRRARGRASAGSRIGGESADDGDGEGDGSKAAAKELARMAIDHSDGGVGSGASGGPHTSQSCGLGLTETCT